jgi:hypothetical protein
MDSRYRIYARGVTFALVFGLMANRKMRFFFKGLSLAGLSLGLAFAEMEIGHYGIYKNIDHFFELLTIDHNKLSHDVKKFREELDAKDPERTTIFAPEPKNNS